MSFRIVLDWKNKELGENSATFLEPGEFVITSFTVILLYLRTSQHQGNREIVSSRAMSQMLINNWDVGLEKPEGRVGSWRFIFNPLEAGCP